MNNHGQVGNREHMVSLTGAVERQTGKVPLGCQLAKYEVPLFGCC
jgi:hypothetical protein